MLTSVVLHILVMHAYVLMVSALWSEEWLAFLGSR